jgi:outer membrane protein assembly factor BamB
MNSQRDMTPPGGRYVGPASLPRLNASFDGAADSLGYFVTDGGVLGQDLTVISVTGETVFAVRFNASLGANKTWSFATSYAFCVLGPSAVFLSSGTKYYALNKSTGELLWTANFTYMDHRGEARLLGSGPADLLGRGQSRGLQVTATRTGTRTPSTTRSATASFNPVVNNVGCGFETLLFPPLITSAGLIIQGTLRCLLGIKSTAGGRLAWYRLTGSYEHYNIDVGAFGTVSFTSPLALSEDEGTFCGGLSTGFVFCSATADGSLLWTSKVTRSAAGVTGTPLIHNRTLYVYAPTNNVVGAPGTLFVFAYSLSGTPLWNFSLTTEPNGVDGKVGFSVLPAFVSASVDAIVISTRRVFGLAVSIINPANASLLRTVVVPSGAGGGVLAASTVAADATGALFATVVDGNDFNLRLFRINATTGDVTYSLVVGAAAQAVSFPSYLSLVVGGGAVLASDLRGGVYVYR